MNSFSDYIIDQMEKDEQRTFENELSLNQHLLQQQHAFERMQQMWEDHEVFLQKEVEAIIINDCNTSTEFKGFDDYVISEMEADEQRELESQILLDEHLLQEKSEIQNMQKMWHAYEEQLGRELEGILQNLCDSTTD